MTDGERRLWALLRRKQLSGFRFRRQAEIGPYIADFFCPQVRLIVELDGDPHSDESQCAVTRCGLNGWKRMAAV
jgi:very-short-patch-repair endonuclease